MGLPFSREPKGLPDSGSCATERVPKTPVWLRLELASDLSGNTVTTVDILI